jgi:hypothetical protein
MVRIEQLAEAVLNGEGLTARSLVGQKISVPSLNQFIYSNQ